MSSFLNLFKNKYCITEVSQGWVVWTWYKFTMWHLSLTQHLLLPPLLSSQTSSSQRRGRSSPRSGERKRPNISVSGNRGGSTSPLHMKKAPSSVGVKRCRCWADIRLQMACTCSTGRIKGGVWIDWAFVQKWLKWAKAKQPPFSPKTSERSFSTCMLKWAFADCVIFIVWLISALTHLCTKMCFWVK